MRTWKNYIKFKIGGFIYDVFLTKKQPEGNNQKAADDRQGQKGLPRYCVHNGSYRCNGTRHSMTAFAANDPLTVVNNLSDFIFGLIRAIGMILLGFGIVQIGLSLKSHDPSQRANGFLTLAGGVIITFAKEILTLITG